MDKEIGRIKKNETTEIIVRVDEYKGKKGLTIREFLTSDRYTGFTKAGTRISADDFIKFRELINSIDYNEFIGNEKSENNEKSASSEAIVVKKERKKKAKEKVEEEVKEENSEEVCESEAN